MKFFFVLCILYIFISGCTPSAKKLEQNQNCKSAVEGCYYSEKQWYGKVPVMFKEDGYNISIVYGKIIKEKENGFIFDRNRVGAFYDPGPEFFLKDTIIAMIDSSYKIIFGKVPEKYTQSIILMLYISNMDNIDTGVEMLKLFPNESFGFCLNPGRYKIEKIQFKDEIGTICEAVELPNLFFQVEKNALNYIGDIHIDIREDNAKNIYIPFKIIHDPKGAFMYNFGAIGGLLYGLSKLPNEALGFHSILVENNKNFSQSVNLPKIDNLITIEN